jgi:acetolactate decarboxylase
MKHIARLSALFLIVFLSPVTIHAEDARPAIFQYSTLQALLDGQYDGDLTIGQLKKHGDFGIGTVNGLDGELVGVDGRFFQVKLTGEVCEPDDGTKIPFAVVTPFVADSSKNLQQGMNLAELQKALDDRIVSKDTIHAIRVSGVFRFVKARSVPRQERPYKGLKEVIPDQSVFELRNVQGTLVGFRFPSYVGTLNVPGYHFHFMSDDRSQGGHVLDCVTERCEMSLAASDKLQVVLVSSVPGR